MVLTCVSTAGRGRGGEGPPGRDEKEQEPKKDRHCCIGPVAFSEREKMQQKLKSRNRRMDCCLSLHVTMFTISSASTVFSLYVQTHTVQPPICMHAA